MSPEPPGNPLPDAERLIEDIEAGKGLGAVLSAGTSITAINDMIKRIDAYLEAHPLWIGIGQLEDIQDDLTELRDHIANFGLPPRPFQMTDLHLGTPPAPGASEPPSEAPAVQPAVPLAPTVTPAVAPGASQPTGQPTPTPPTVPAATTPPPVAAPSFLPEVDAQRWLTDQQLPHDSPAYRAARDHWLSLVKDLATIAKDTAPALTRPGFRGDIAEGVQYRAEDIAKAVDTAFPDPSKALPPEVPRPVESTGAATPPTRVGAGVQAPPAPLTPTPRRALTFGQMTMLLVLLLLLAGGVVYLVGRGSAPASSVGANAPAAVAPAAAESMPAASVPVPAVAESVSAVAESVPAVAESVPTVAVAITNNVLVDNVGSPCTAPTTLHMKWVLRGVAPGTTIVVGMSGPGLPTQATFVVASDGSVVKDYTVPAGAAVWTTDLTMIGNKPAPTGNAKNKSSVSCSGG